MRKPENTLIKGVEKYLPPNEPHREKMANPYRGGTADTWYSGNKNDLWIEWKWIAKLPVVAPIKVNLSQLQIIWLNKRYIEGRNVGVIIGSPEGCLLLRNRQWERTDIYSAEFKNNCRSRKEIAEWILKETMKNYPR